MSAPLTGYHTVDHSQYEEAVALYFPSTVPVGEDAPLANSSTMKGVRWTSTTGGINNVTRFIHVDEKYQGPERGQRFVFRIYNNSGNIARVRFEHAVIAAIHKKQQQQGGRRLSYEIPKAKLSVRGNSFEVLSDGVTGCCVFRWIPGVLAGSTTKPFDLGYAAAQLTHILDSIYQGTEQRETKTEDDAVLLPPCPTAPYYDLWRVHQAIGSRGTFDKVMKENHEVWFSTASVVDDVYAHMTELLQRINRVDDTIAGYCDAKRLPLTIIHGDLHYDNVVVAAAQQEQQDASSSSPAVTGLLDFEFVAYDWRAMELAICLSKYFAETNPMISCADFCRGYLYSTSGNPSGVALTEVERRSIPSLIALRILSNVVYFIGRAVAQEDSITAITSRAASYCKRLRWLDDHAEELAALLTASSDKEQ